MCNISTDGTSLNEPEISTGHHTLDKGKQHFSSAWCVSTREMNNRDHFIPPLDEELCITIQGSILMLSQKSLDFFLSKTIVYDKKSKI